MLLVLAVLFLGAQSQAPAPTSSSGLADRYVDGTYRFSIQPPQGWQIIPRREHLRDGSIVLRLVQVLPDRRFQEIVLTQFETSKPKIGEMLNQSARELELQYSAVRIVTQQEQQIAGRPAGYLAATFRRDNASHLHLAAIIDLGKSQGMSITYQGPHDMRSQSEPLFGRCLASLQLLRDQMSDKELEAAFEAGSTLLASLTEKRIRERLIPDQMLRIESQGKPIGFLRIQQADYVLDKRPGVRIAERGWIFATDGRIQRIQNSMFVSYDLKTEKWKTSITAIPPNTSGRDEVLEVRLEEGVRNGDALLTNQTHDMLEPVVTNPALSLPKMYLSRALGRMLPAIIGDLVAKQRVGFVEFDHNKGGLVIRIAETKGASELPVSLSAAGETALRRMPRGERKLYRIEQREGPAGEPMELYVDSLGRIVVSRSGNLTYSAAAAEELEKEFATRVASAEERMNALEKAYQQDEQRFIRPPGR